MFIPTAMKYLFLPSHKWSPKFQHFVPRTMWLSAIGSTILNTQTENKHYRIQTTAGFGFQDSEMLGF